MRFLFLSAPMPGHLDWGGYLATAAELSVRGHTVLWVSGEAVRSNVEQAGVPFAALTTTGWRWPPPPPLAPPVTPNDAGWQQERARRALDQWLATERVEAAIAELLPLAQRFQPDVVITEMFLAAGGFVAELLQRPLVVAGWPAMQTRQSGGDSALAREARSRWETICRHWGIKGSHWTQDGPPALCSASLHVTYWSPTWYQGLPLLPQTRHAGGQAPAPQPPDAALPNPGERPWLLITLGTSFNDDPAFFANAAQAVEELGCLPIVVLGRSADKAELAAWSGRLPASACVRTWVEFPAVLPYVAAAIHHGGAGTTHALATHGVPQIVTPHAADQVHQANGVARSGVGFHIGAKQATVDNLARALAVVLPGSVAPTQRSAGAPGRNGSAWRS